MDNEYTMFFCTFVKFIKLKNMKRFFLLYSFLTLCLVVIEANPVSKAQALQEAKAFLQTKGVEMQTTIEAYKAPRKVGSKESNPYYYIYNVGNDKGFVIVSGDDRTEKILGYVDSGSFNEEDAPTPLMEWLKGYEREIESLTTVQGPSITPKRKVVEKTKRSIAPMTTSKWKSGYPFNTATPIVDGSNSPVGCSPVCFAQFLYYYRNQNVKALTNTVPAYIDRNNNTIEAIPAGTTLDWDNMIDDYVHSTYNTTQKNAVADLMAISAKALQTSFYSNTALTSTANFHPALINYFGFDDAIAFVNREYYSVDDWENIIYNEIVNKRPVVYNGFSSITGHTFLIDGYDASGFFHINWGWAGQDDGYFRLSVLNRYQSGSTNPQIITSTYTDKQSILLYAVPSSLGCVNTSNNQLNGKIISASGSTVACKYHNQSGLEGYYQYGVGYEDEDGQVVLIKKYNNSFVYLNNTSSASRYYGISANDLQNADMDYGTYQLVPVYKYIDHSDWKICQHESANYAILNYSASGISCSVHSNFPNISITNVELIGDGLSGSEQVIRVTIDNSSDKYSYSEMIYCFATNTSSIGDAIGSARVNMNKMEEVTIDFPFTPTESGNYDILIATDSYGDNVLGETEITIESETNPSLDISDVNFDVNKNYVYYNGTRSIWGNVFSVDILGIKNTSDYTIRKELVVWLRKYDSISSSSWSYNDFVKYGKNGSFYPVEIVVPPHSECKIPIVFEDLQLNTKYDIRLRYKSGELIFTTWSMILRPALTTWNADGSSISVEPTESMTIDDDVVAVDITDATTIQALTPNSNPNVLYYMGANQTVPEGLSNANVVKGTVAEDVTLLDNNDFFVPKTFTANTISFTTTPSMGAASNSNVGWNTIALPFDVTSVKNTTDNKEIDWFHPGETSGKDFWVRGFESLDKNGDIIFVDNVEKMYAYEPYLYNVPGEYWGKRRCLVGKDLTFYGENATLHKDVNVGVHSSAFNLMGTTIGKTVNDAWFINAEGDAFLYATSQEVPAFHAYFVDSEQYFSSLVSPSEKPALHIKFRNDAENATSIQTAVTTNEDQVDVYNLQGVKVATLPFTKGNTNLYQLPKGVYIIGGKKVIR